MTATVQPIPTTTLPTPGLPARLRVVTVPIALAAVAAAWWSVAVSHGFDEVVPTLSLVLVVAWSTAGVVLAARRPDEPMGTILLAATTVAGVALAADATLSDDPGRTGLELARGFALGLLPAVALHVLVALPTGHLARRWHRHLVAAGYAVGAGSGIGMFAARPSVPLSVLAGEAALAAAVGWAVSNARYARSRGQERQRMQWFGWAVAIATEVTLVALALRLFLGWPQPVGEIAATATVLIPLSFLPCAFQRVLGRVDRLLGHTVSFTGLTGVVVAVYLVIVLGLGRAPHDDERTILLLSMVAAGIAALLYVPTRARLAGFSNRLVYGERHAPDEALQTFGSRLSRAIPLDELLLQLAESLRKTMSPRAAEVWTGSEGVLERVASAPDRGAARLTLSETERPVVARAGVSGPAWLDVWLPALLDGRGDAVLRVAPVTHSGELLGLIVVERAADDEAFAADDDSVLAELARQVGLALHNVQLDSALQESLRALQRQAEELRASRARVVAAADAARRKIERNLHDGAQQHLVGLAVTVRLAQQLAESEPEQVKGLLEQLGEDLRGAVQELRDLAHGIYPPVLMDHGLVAALESAATRAAMPVSVAAADVGRFPEEAEAAVYFCCLEALQNAGKHAGDGAQATVMIRREAAALVFEVADDGVGFDPASAKGGHGFVNMRDRIGAIGGTLTVDAAPGRGTTVSGTVPSTSEFVGSR